MEQKNRLLSSLSSSASLFLLLLFFDLTGLSVNSASASTFISDHIFADRASIGRNLLQAKKSCPVNFEFMNYTIVTSQCKGPRYPADLCCAALTEFACPYVDQINDLTNDCATTMFSYINLYGKYPPGLFSSECREGKQGLACTATPPSESANASGSQIIRNPPPLLLLATGLLVLSLQLF